MKAGLALVAGPVINWAKGEDEDHMNQTRVQQFKIALLLLSMLALIAVLGKIIAYVGPVTPESKSRPEEIRDSPRYDGGKCCGQ